MKLEFNSNTVMTIIMGVTLLGGGYQYIENKIDAVAKAVPVAYDDTLMNKRIDTLEAKDVSQEFAVLQQQISDLPIPKDYSEAINSINVQLAKIQTKLENLEKHDHNGEYVRNTDK